MEIAHFHDHLYTNSSPLTQRHTARALIVNELCEFLFLHIVGEDVFGMRNHYETVGGGVELDESMERAMLREVKEETGYDGVIMEYLGDIVDEYLLLCRETISHFFVVGVKMSSTGNTSLTQEEQALVAGMVWVNEDQVHSLLDIKKQEGGIGELIHRRDLFAFEFYLSKKSVR